MSQIESGTAISPSEGNQPARVIYVVAALLGLALSGGFYWWLMKLPASANLAQDELWGATLVNLSFFDAIVFVLRFDVHPPLYYMQLNLWALVGNSDAWLQANSILWLFATALVVFRLVDRTGSRLAALVAATMTLSTPLLGYYAFEVRMYTFLAFLAVLGTLYSERVLAGSGRDTRRRDWAILFLVSVAIIYSYAIGALIVGAQFMFGMVTAWQAGLRRKLLVRWLGLHAVLGLLAAPVAVNSLMRGTSHADAPDLEIVLGTISEIYLGNGGAIFGPYMAVVQIGLLALCLLAIFRNAPARRLILSYVLLPIVVSLIVSHALAPMWLTRSFIFTIPIFWIAIGRFLGGEMMRARSEAGPILRAAVAVVALFVILVQADAIYREASTPRLPNYRDIVSYISERASAGDCIVAMNGIDVFWGVSRYFAGEDWDGGLQIQAKPTERWAQILEAIPARIKEGSGLTPVSDHFTQGGIKVFAGYPSDAETCRHVFLVGKPADFPAAPPGAAGARITARSGPVILRELSVWPVARPTE